MSAEPLTPRAGEVGLPVTRRAAFPTRLGTGTVLVGLTASILFFTPPLYFSLLVVAFAALALHEFLTLLKEAHVPVYRVFGVAMGIAIPLVVHLEFGATQSGEILFLVLGCFCLFLLQFFHKHDPQALIGISLTLFGILYVSWFLSFMIKIRFLPGGMIWAAYLLAVTKAQDIGAYAVGMPFGRHSLIPHISPNKSVEGAFGGILAGMATAWALGPVLPLPFAPWHTLLIGAFVGLIGQIGDLSESLMKRFCRSKDSGRIFPGLGGALDAVDSILFTAPIFYFHLKIFL